MKNKNIGLLLFIVGILLMMGSIFLIIYEKDNAYTKKGNCYDRYGSLINGMKCDVRVSPISSNFFMILLSVGYALFMVFCIITGVHLMLFSNQKEVKK